MILQSRFQLSDPSFKFFKVRKGQSLAEMLVAITVALVLIGSAALLIGVSLRSSSGTRYRHAASFLAQDLLDKVRVYTEGLWYCDPGTCTTNSGIYNLLKGSGNHYYLDTTASPFTWVSGDETGIVVDVVPYTRYFFVENVNRDASGNIVASGGVEDPSTQKVTVVVEWQEQGSQQSISISGYLTRHTGNRVFNETDWSGGPDPGAPPKPEPDGKFASSTNIDWSTPGEIKIQ